MDNDHDLRLREQTPGKNFRKFVVRMFIYNMIIYDMHLIMSKTIFNGHIIRKVFYFLTLFNFTPVYISLLRLFRDEIIEF